MLDVVGREEKRDYLRDERRERGDGRRLRSTLTRTQEQHINNINILSCSSSSSPLSYHHMI